MTDIENYVADPKPGQEPGSRGGGALTMSPRIRILTYWQGIVEIGLRAVTLFLVFLTFITSAIAVGQLNDLSSRAEEFIDESDNRHDRDDRVPDTPNLVSLSRGAGGFLIFFAIVVIFYEALVIVLRFLNISIINQYIVIVLVVDAVVCGVVAFIYLVTGAVCGRYSALWDDWVEFGDDFRDDYLVSSSDIDSAENIRGALGATSAFCIFEMLVLIGTAGWLLVSVFFKWYLPPQRNIANTGS